MQQNTPFTVSADHDGAGVESFHLYIDGDQKQALPVADLVAGVIAFPVPEGLPKGSYTVAVSAKNAAEEASSEPLTLVVTGDALKAPVNIRISLTVL